MKKCTGCKKTKPLSGFHKGKCQCKTCVGITAKLYYKNNKTAINATCKKYQENNRDKTDNRRLMAKYGITLSEYDTMRLKQNYSCMVCGRHEDDVIYKKAHRSLHVDHDHNTGRVRGLLCAHCNRALGLFGDNTGVLHRAIKYLQLTKGEKNERKY